MANNIGALKTAFIAFLTSTTALDAATKKLLRDGFVLTYEGEWTNKVATGTADTAANRASFAIDKTYQFWREVVRAASAKKNAAAMPALEDIE